MVRFPLVSALLSLLLAGIACDDDYLENPGDEPDDPRSTVEGLITEYLPSVYSEMDSAGYAAALDTSYWFKVLPEDVEPASYPDGGWGWEREMRITRRMFGGHYNRRGGRILHIDLHLTEESRAELESTYPGKPGEQVWYEVVALVDMTLLIEQPSMMGGLEVRPYIVWSRQEFVVRPDRGDARKWSIIRQEDRPFLNKTEVDSGTDEVSWGAMKQWFFFAESDSLSVENGKRVPGAGRDELLDERKRSW